MKIYHGEAGDPDLERCREAAPSFDHRVMLTSCLTRRQHIDYALDNGAFVVWNRGEHWLTSGRAEEFVRRLRLTRERENKPDFVILPDVVMDPFQTARRSYQWAQIIREELGLDFPLYVAVQNGMTPEWAVEFAAECNADGIFVGGDMDYKRDVTPQLVDSEFPVHVGRPENLVWAREVGVDSVDTTSIIRNNAWHRLEQLEEQEPLIA